MNEYIDRLVKCGYTTERATAICVDFIRNLGMFDLQLFVEVTEDFYRKKHVEVV